MKSMPSSGKRSSVRTDLVMILRLAPDAAAGDAHGAEAEAIDCEIPADLELTGLGCVEI